MSTDWKADNYDSILVFVDRFTQTIHYKLVKVTINTTKLVEVIIDVMVWYYNLPNSILIDRGAIFISKFWSLLYYFFDIKKEYSITFYPKTDEQTEEQNRIKEAYFCTFVIWE